MYGGVVGMNIVVDFQREDKTMSALPTEEHVLSEIKKLLEDMEVSPGWNITVVAE